MKFFGAATLLASAFAPAVLAQVSFIPLPPPVQTYFIPLPEPDLFKTFTDTVDTVSGDVNTVISIAIASDNTVIYYDHFEDGFDVAPDEDACGLLCGTTEIWGNNNPDDGFPPGNPMDLPLQGGSAIVLENAIDINNLGLTDYDGGDRVQASLPIAITRYAFPEFVNTGQGGAVLAGAVEVFSTATWRTRHIIPVGNNTVSETNAFEYAVAYVQAGLDATRVFLNGNQVGGELALGESVVIPIAQGDEITADKIIQVDLLAGDVGDKYELRWYSISGVENWDSEYISPVAQKSSDSATGFWFYNPNPTAITIDYEGAGITTGSFTLPPGVPTFAATATLGETAINAIIIPLSTAYSGVKFSSTSSEPFYALAQIDTFTNGRKFDWGFPLIPQSQLTSQVLVGMGRGCATGCTASVLPRSVVWVTPVADTKIFIDYEGDGTFDDVQDVAAYDSVRYISNNVDGDLTGAIIYATLGDTPDGAGNPVPSGDAIDIAVAWGQDPVNFLSNDAQGLDLGTAIVPLANPFISKNFVNVTNPDGSPDSDNTIDEVGDVVFYEIFVSNVGLSSLSSVNVLDPLVGNTLSGPRETGATDGVLSRGESWVYTGSYTVQASDLDTTSNADSDIDNTACVTSAEYNPVCASVEVPIRLSKISGTVFEDTDNDNEGEVTLSNVLIVLIDNATGLVIATTVTDANGFYEFTGLSPGDYTVAQTNLPGYLDVTPGSIAVILDGSSDSTGNDFVDEQPSEAPSASPSVSYSIGGTVFEDTDNDDVGDIPLSGVFIQLLDSSGTVIATTVTDSVGDYVFDGLGPGDYTVEQINLPGYTDVTPGSIPVTIDGADSTGNDFVDELPSEAPSGSPSAGPSASPSVSYSIGGTVFEDTDNDDDGDIPLSGVFIQLLDSSGTVIATTVTDSVGEYVFDGLGPGDYTVEQTNLPGYTDVTPGSIPVTIDGADSTGNDFIDELPSEAPSGSPSRSPSASPSVSYSIGGTVFEDTDNNDTGDIPLSGVFIQLLDSSGTVIATTVTDSVGEYVFDGLGPGDYTVEQTNLPGYTDVTPGSIPVTIDGADSTGNDFVDELPSEAPSGSPSRTPSASPSVSYSIGGTVFEDTDNNDTGDIPLSGVFIQLLDSSGTVIATTVTDSIGEYVFDGLGPGDYTVEQTNLPGYTDVTPGSIPVTIDGADSTGNDFVDELPSEAPSGSPSEGPSASPSASPSATPSNEPSVVRSMMPSPSPSSNPTVVASESPSAAPSASPSAAPSAAPSSSPSASPSGAPSASPSNEPSVVRSTMPSPSPSSNPTVVASESPSAAPSASPSAAPSAAPSSAPSASPTDAPSASPSNEPSVVRSFMPSPSPSSNPTVVASASPSAAPSAAPSASPSNEPSVERSVMPSPSPSAGPTVVASASPSSSPSAAPSASPSNEPSVERSVMPSPSPSAVPTVVASTSPSKAPVTLAPVTRAPVTLAPTESDLKCVFEDDKDSETCSCLPFRSPDYCPADESFAAFVMKRKRLYQNEPDRLTAAGFWFHELEDKVGAKYFLDQLYVSTPQTHCCETDVDALSQCLMYLIDPMPGFVIKVSNEHSNTAVYPLSKNGDLGYINLLNGESYTVEDVLDELRMMTGSNKFIVEELVSNYLPLEVKFHVFKGEVGAIELISGRGTDCPCFATIDTQGNRLDQNGCFEPFGSEYGEYDSDGCVLVDYDAGKSNAGKIKNDLGLCLDIPDIADCLLQEMVNTASAIGTKIGTYMRVDMFVTDPSSAANGKYYVQEFAANPMNGLRHCAATVDEAGCVDPCFLGKMWATAGSMTGANAELNSQVGGMATTPPPEAAGIINFGKKTPQEMCDAIKGATKQQPWSCSFGKFQTTGLV